MLILIFSRTYTANARGGTIREVHCEKCQTPYWYELLRTSVARSSLSNGRAQRIAEKKLGKRLKRESESVPCPQCGWIQAEMIAKRHGRIFRKFLKAGFWILGLSVPVLFCIATGTTSRHQDRMFESLKVAAIVIAAAVVAMWIIARIALGLRNPNRAFPAPPKVPPGTPPALRTAQTATGITFEVARDFGSGIQRGWIEWNAVRPLVGRCCVCLDETSQTYHTLSEHPRQPEVPLCRQCQRKVTERWWIWAAVCVTAVVSLGEGTVLLLTGGRPFDSNYLSIQIIAGIIGVILLATLPNGQVRPYRRKNVDKSRDIVRLKFRNPRYTEFVAGVIANEKGNPEFVGQARGFEAIPTK